MEGSVLRQRRLRPRSRVIPENLRSGEDLECFEEEEKESVEKAWVQLLYRESAEYTKRGNQYKPRRHGSNT